MTLRDRAINKMANMEIANCGRWATITIKKTGEVLTLQRLGYGPMERPHSDKHQLLNSEKQVLVVGEGLGDIADYILNHF